MSIPPGAAATGNAARRSVCELAFVDLPSDLESNDEEEDRHQAVVDPEVDGLLDGQVTCAEAERQLDEVVVSGGPGRVGDHHRRDRRDEENDAARRLDAKERLDRRDDALHPTPRHRRGLGRSWKTALDIWARDQRDLPCNERCDEKTGGPTTLVDLPQAMEPRHSRTG